jgi:hypothetical protein
MELMLLRATPGSRSSAPLPPHLEGTELPRRSSSAAIPGNTLERTAAQPLWTTPPNPESTHSSLESTPEANADVFFTVAPPCGSPISPRVVPLELHRPSDSPAFASARSAARLKRWPPIDAWTELAHGHPSGSRAGPLRRAATGDPRGRRLAGREGRFATPCGVLRTPPRLEIGGKGAAGLGPRVMRVAAREQ